MNVSREAASTTELAEGTLDSGCADAPRDRLQVGPDVRVTP